MIEKSPWKPSATQATQDPIDVGQALIDLAGDRELFEEVLAVLVEGLPQQVAELREASAQADLQRMRTLAHTLKGTASNICASDVSHLAQKMERELARVGVQGVRVLLPELLGQLTRLQEFAATLLKKT